MKSFIRAREKDSRAFFSRNNQKAPFSFLSEADSLLKKHSRHLIGFLGAVPPKDLAANLERSEETCDAWRNLAPSVHSSWGRLFWLLLYRFLDSKVGEVFICRPFENRLCLLW
jgi:hypothetical protein